MLPFSGGKRELCRRAKDGSMSKKENDKEIKTGEREMMMKIELGANPTCLASY